MTSWVSCIAPTASSAADQARRHGHREDRGPGDHEPLADGVGVASSPRAGSPCSGRSARSRTGRRAAERSWRPRRWGSGRRSGWWPWVGSGAESGSETCGSTVARFHGRTRPLHPGGSVAVAVRSCGRDDRRRLRDPRRPRRRRARRDHRRGLAADLPDLDLPPGRRQPARAAATTTPGASTRPASGSSGRSRRSSGGDARDRLRQRLGGDGGDRPVRVEHGDEIVVGDDVYGGTFRYLERVHRPSGAADARFVDLAGRPGPALGAAHRPDPARLVRDARRTRTSSSSTSPPPRGRSATAPPRPAPRGRSSSSTTRSPRRPSRTRSTLGADIVFHSATKYLGGHSRHDPRDRRHPRRRRSPSGSTSSRTRWARCPGPLDCFLVLRGLRTLHLRVERHVGQRDRDRDVPRAAATTSRRCSTRA